jgi:hypothetical protein
MSVAGGGGEYWLFFLSPSRGITYVYGFEKEELGVTNLLPCFVVKEGPEGNFAWLFRLQADD